jgi:hypothetical protein
VVSPGENDSTPQRAARACSGYHIENTGVRVANAIRMPRRRAHPARPCDLRLSEIRPLTIHRADGSLVDVSSFSSPAVSATSCATLRDMMNDAVADELIATSTCALAAVPCSPATKSRPSSRPARTSLEDRHVPYAIMFIGGMRSARPPR